jgi:SAM-dependent methyltransferase
MKPSALDVYVCPPCQSELALISTLWQGAEVLEGSLRCADCGRRYPIVRGVPRFVEADAYAASFGEQWNWFRQVQLDSCNGTNRSRQALAASTGWAPEAFAGRLVLDAGVGAGRFAECAAAYGGRVFGVDVSSAIDAAYLNIGRRDHVHLAQADIFALPFRNATFDLAYSIGVLHHTPDPAAAFGRVATTVKPQGQLAVYLYSRYGVNRHVPDLIRRVTTRLPRKVMLGLSLLAVPAYFVYRVPVLGRFLSLGLPISDIADWRWRWLDTFDWFTPKYQWKFLYPEVFRWFQLNGFRDVEIFDDPIRMRGVKAAEDLSSGADRLSRVVAS